MKTLGIITASLLLFVAAGTRVVHAQSGTVTATVRPNPLKVTVLAPSSVGVGQWFDITSDVTNLGDQSITGIEAIIQTPTEVTVKGRKKKVGTIAGGVTSTVTWRAKANSSDNFFIQVEVSGNLAGEQIFSSDSVKISATGSLGAFLFRLIFGV